MMAGKLAISINGGGALGIGCLHFLSRLEFDLGKSLTKISVAHVGTSTGAIIASCLSEGLSATDIYDLYKSNVKKMFTKYPFYKRILPTCPTYDNRNLKDILKKVLKGKCSDWKKPTFITTTFMNGKSAEKVWDIEDEEEKWFAVLTSTAAPTYFDVLSKDGNYYCDGGLWSNDPIMVLQSGLKKKHPKWNIKILSINTAMDVPNTDTVGNRTLVGWGSYMLKNWIARTGMSDFFEASVNLGDENVFRASPVIDRIYKMDKTSDKDLNEVIDIWDKYYEEVKVDLLKWVKAC